MLPLPAAVLLFVPLPMLPAGAGAAAGGPAGSGCAFGAAVPLPLLLPPAVVLLVVPPPFVAGVVVVVAVVGGCSGWSVWGRPAGGPLAEQGAHLAVALD